MKPLLISLLLTIFYLAGMQTLMAQSGFVTLEGHQFKLGGEDFYPKACCYSFSLAYNGTFSLSGVYIAPNNGFGPGSIGMGNPFYPNFDFESYTASSSLDEIAADFHKIDSMGFDAIRTHGLSPDMSPDYENGFRFSANSNVVPLYNTTLTNIDILPPYDNNNEELQKYFELVDQVLTLAEEEGLKVLFDIGTFPYSSTSQTVDDYNEFLKAVACHFKDNTTIMAYVIYEEPTNVEKNIFHTKQQICQITSKWYDSMKAIDPNHLITIGGGSDIFEIDQWDPAVMKLDFYCPHFYFNTVDYEGPDQAKMFNRILGRLYWLQENCTMPWLVGETGHSAMDDFYTMVGSTWTNVPQVFPEVEGDFDDQTDFAEMMLPAIQNYGGSGYTWWQFQETWWNSPIDDGKGILKHGDRDAPETYKPVSNVIRQYNLNPPPPVSMEMPDNYYDPYLRDEMNSAYPSVTGTVKDEDGVNNIKDAVILGWLHLFYDPPTNSDFTEIIYTFSNSEGKYKLNPFHPVYSLTFLHKILISHSGYEKHSTPWYFNNSLVTYNANLKSANLTNHLTLSNVNPPPNEHTYYSAFSTVTVEDMTLSPTSSVEMAARDEITVQPNFTAHCNSSLHVYCTPQFVDCESIDFSNQMKSYYPLSIVSENQQICREIEVKFLILEENDQYTITPNPNKGEFHVIYKTSSESNVVSSIMIYSSLGKCITKLKPLSENNAYNISYLPEGLYFIRIIGNEMSQTLKMIKF